MKDLRVFVSHASKDAQDAEMLVHHLERKGVSCWISTRDIPNGKEFAEVLVEAIDGADLMVVLLTETANESQHVVREINRAVDRRKPILPVRMGNFELSKSMQYYLSHTQWLFIEEGVSLEESLPAIEAAIKTPAKDGRSKNDVPRPIVVPRRSGLGAVVLGAVLAVVLLGAGVWFGGEHFKPDAEMPLEHQEAEFTAEQKNALGEALSYTGMHMMAVNNAFTSMQNLYREATSYVEGTKDEEAWRNFTALLDHAKQQVTVQQQTPKPLPERVAQVLQGTEVSVADVTALHQFLKMQTDDFLNTVEVLRHQFNPDSPMSVAHQKELLRIYGEILQESGKTIYFGVCEFLSPVAEMKQVQEWRSEVVRDWVYFDSSYQPFWEASPKTLEDAQNQAWEKLQSLMTDLATLTGNMQGSLNDMEQIVESRRLLLDQLMADWQGLDGYVQAVSNAVTPEALAAITTLWDGTESVSPGLRIEHHQRQSALLRDAVTKAGAAAFDGVAFSDALRKFAEKGDVPPEIIRAVYEAMGTVREKHEWLLDRIKELHDARKRPDVERYAEEVSTAAEKASGWAEAAHLVCLRTLGVFPAELQEKPLERLGAFQALTPKALPAPEKLLELEKGVMERLSQSVDTNRAQVEATKARLGEVEQQLEKARKRVREQCRITPEDDPGLVIGKARRLRETGLIEEAVAAFEQYGSIFGNMGEDAGDHLAPEAVRAYTKLAVHLTRNLAEYGVEGGAFIFGFQDCTDRAPLQKYDVVIRFDGRPAKDADAFVLELKAAKAAGDPVTVEILRLDANGAIQAHEATYTPDQDCLVGVLDI